MMGTRRLSVFLATVAVGGGVVWAQAERTAARVRAARIGEPAPDFVLKSTEGKTVKLSDRRGKVVVLEWTNHRCPVVGQYVVKKKLMQKTFARYRDKGVVWFGIDSSSFCEDAVAQIKEFRERNGISYPTLLDAAGKVGRLYGASNTPHMFVIDQKGRLAYAGSMDDDRYGDKTDAQNYVADAVDALLTGSTVAVSKTKPFGCSVKYKQ